MSNKTKIAPVECIDITYNPSALIWDTYGEEIPRNEADAFAIRYQQALEIYLQGRFPGADISIKPVLITQSRNEPYTRAYVPIYGHDISETAKLKDAVKDFDTHFLPGREAMCLLADDQGLCEYKDIHLLGGSPHDGGPWLPEEWKEEPRGWSVSPGLWLHSQITGNRLYVPFR